MEKNKKNFEKRPQKKENIKVEEKKTKNRVIFNKDVKKGAKVIGIILTFIASMACIFVFLFGIITSLKAANNTKVELLNDNFSVTFISNINNLSVTETENIIQGSGSKTLFIAFNIVIPAIAIIAVSILIIILVKKILDFINGITTEKELYTKDNLEVVEKLACIMEAIITVTFIIFEAPNLLLYMLISVLLFIIIGLFNRCIEYQK